MPNIIDVLINWFPMLLLVAVWLFFLRQMRSGKNLSKYQIDRMEQQKRQSDLLERIAVALEKNAAK